uniref:Uncharacterized protein n=1 Tax=Siphoviridae sp. ctr0c13 TaxID=2825683 RepID=A0A8S5TV14_9CAUD|nr:MAG TPA: hypothetical protein [Siphoviridae sp. ctr0c13]
MLLKRMAGKWQVMDMANGKIANTAFTDAGAIFANTSLKAKAVHVEELRKAIAALEGYAENVDNCGNCRPCQACQGCQTCQKCQSASCQSAPCQTCQTYSIYCQSNCSGNCSQCKQCHDYSKDCDCDCGDDTG